MTKQKEKAKKWVKSLTAMLAVVGSSTMLSMPAALAKFDSLYAQARPRCGPGYRNGNCNSEPAQSGFYCDNSGNGLPQTRYKNHAGRTEVWINWSSDYFADAGYDPLRRCQIVSGRLENYRRNRQLNYIGVGWQNGQEIICAARRSGQCVGLIYTLKPGQDANQTLERFMRLRRGEASARSMFESGDDAALFIDVRELIEQGSPSPRIAPAPPDRNRPQQPQQQPQRNNGGMREL